MLGSVDALSTLRGDGQKDSVLEGLHLLQATSAEPNPVKFKLIGTELNICLLYTSWIDTGSVTHKNIKLEDCGIKPVELNSYPVRPDQA